MGYYLTNKVIQQPAESTDALQSHLGTNTPIGAPFGNPILSTKYWDEDAKLSYYGYRYYGPGMGRWLSRDPLGCLGFRNRNIDNLYLFVHNRSLNSIDYFGLFDSFKVVGDTIQPPSKDADWWERLRRNIGRTIGSLVASIAHVDVYHGDYLIRNGYSGPPLNGAVYEPTGNRKTWVLEVTKLGELAWGKAKGTKCGCASHDEIQSCVAYAPTPRFDEYDTVFNNCQHDVEHAISGCCLTGYNAVGFGWDPWNYMTNDERWEWLEMFDWIGGGGA